ncbi:helix-turn-helix transcriptional regulator [Gulbenkiania mobilis]|uniref:helix-turn-helix transcriptional regulator n=1 Tax=Gulbenkiania mobilis TaxID=397457 RepID=UPI0009FA501F|nr:helix-turn-helix transcriptional regulator [Gulbenkiania mobilis]
MLNEALRLVRVYHDLSQSQLCVLLGISNSYLSEIESGKKQPSLDLLGKYSVRFDVPVSSLLFFSENLDNPKITDKIRIGAARKIVSLLQWVEQKNEGKNSATS